MPLGRLDSILNPLKATPSYLFVYSNKIEVLSFLYMDTQGIATFAIGCEPSLVNYAKGIHRRLDLRYLGPHPQENRHHPWFPNHRPCPPRIQDGSLLVRRQLHHQSGLLPWRRIVPNPGPHPDLVMHHTIAQQANLDPTNPKHKKTLQDWASHLLRVGATNLLYAAKFSGHQIQIILRWDSLAFMDYFRNLAIISNEQNDTIAAILDGNNIQMENLF